MKHLFFADMNRLSRHFFRWMFVIIGMIIYVYVDYIMLQNEIFGSFSSSAFVEIVTKLSAALPLIVGILELFFVFRDDMKARASHSAIGCGVKRHMIVLSKYCEVLIFAFTDVVLYFAGIVLIGLAAGVHLVLPQYREIIITLFVMWLKIAAYTGLSLIPVFTLQGVAAGLLVYIVLFFKIPYYLLSFIVYEIFSYEPAKFTLTDNLDVIKTYMLAGITDIRPLLIVLLYTALGVCFTMLIFRRKELDF